MNAICLSITALNAADPLLRSQILQLAGLEVGSIPDVTPDFEPLATGSAFSMSREFAKEFLTKCSPKTKKTLTFICEMDGQFLHSELEARVAMGRLSGVWTGITNRLRKMTEDRNAVLIDWDWDDEREGWTGVINQVTLESLRAALVK